MLVVDAAPIVTAAATRDRHQAACVSLLASAPRSLVVPAHVVTEVAYFLSDRIGDVAERAFARSLARDELLVEPVELRDWLRIEELLDEYADRRHFSVVRPRHCPALELLPG